MVVIRTFLAALIALSIAVLPATGEAIASPGPVGIMTADQMDMPCCPSGDTKDDFKGTTCVLKCAALVGVVVPVMTAALPFVAHRCLRTSTDDRLHGLVRAPPTHPPRA